MSKLIQVRQGETFDHTDGAGVRRVFDVTRMHTEFLERPRIWGKRGVKLVYLVLDEAGYQVCLKNNGVEEERLALTNAADDLLPPAISCEWDDGTESLIDGNHRYVKRWRAGKREMVCWLVPWNAWQEFADVKSQPQSALAADCEEEARR